MLIIGNEKRKFEIAGISQILRRQKALQECRVVCAVWWVEQVTIISRIEKSVSVKMTEVKESLTNFW